MSSIKVKFCHLADVPLPHSGRLPGEIAANTHCCNAVMAKELGYLTYFTGQPCRHGHLSDRYLSNKQCVECRVLQTRLERKRAEKPRQEVPPCLHSNNTICEICPRRERCAGAGGTNLLTRVQLAFPDWPLVSRAVAVQRKFRFYKPTKRCRRCGKAAWRRVLDDLCSGCQL